MLLPFDRLGNAYFVSSITKLLPQASSFFCEASPNPSYPHDHKRLLQLDHPNPKYLSFKRACLWPHPHVKELGFSPSKRSLCIHVNISCTTSTLYHSSQGLISQIGMIFQTLVMKRSSGREG